MNNYSNITLNARQLEQVEQRVAARFAGVRRYTRPEGVAAMPGSLLVPLTRSEFRALSGTDRELHVLNNLRDEIVEALKARIAARLSRRQHTPAAYAPSASASLVDTDDPTAPPLVDPYAGTQHGVFVPCMGGCGTLIPCRPGRPTLRVCSPAPVQLATTRPAGARQFNADGQPAKQRARRRRAVCGVTAAERTEWNERAF